MIRKILVCGVLISTLGMAGCASMTDSERRVGTGAAIGGAAAGIISGDWGWAAAGAAAGAVSGYLYDQSKQNEQRAYERGVKDAQKR